MKLLKYPFWLVYRIWFYIVMAIPILVMSPLLICSLIKESWYPYFFKLARIWARFILIFMWFKVKISRDETTDINKSYMFVANHTSMTDIMLMLVSVKNPFVFVGKAELAKIPVFGFFYRRSSILVDRNNPKSRQAVFLRAQKRLNQGLSICIFPEGLVPEEHIDLSPFKDGAFRLAINHNIPIVPLTFGDNKKRFSYTFFSGSPGKMRVKMHQFIPTKLLEAKDTKDLKTQTEAVIRQQLRNYSKK